MKKENRQHILNRYLLVLAFIAVICIGSVWHLVDTTVISADKWNDKAMKHLTRMDTIQPERGNILAADGSVLATNLRYYNVRIDYRASKFAEKLLTDTIDVLADSMAVHFPQRTAAGWRKFLLAPLAKPDTLRPRSYKILANISYADYLLLRKLPFFSLKNTNYNGVVKETVVRRANPYGSMALRSIGRVGATKESREIHGRSGLEMALDSLLYGQVGLAKKVPLTRGIVNWTDVPPVHGYNIQTTIDIKLQDIVENELNNMLEAADADWGVAVLMDVATGDIKAISNLEADADSHGFIEGQNRAVLGFEPGSVVKTLSMMIALENGAAGNPGELITTGQNYKYADGPAIRDCSPKASIQVGEVLERSSNIGMTRIITRKYGSNPGEFYSAIKRTGFLEPLNVGIGGERRPRIDSLGNNNGARIALSRQCYGYATEIPPLHTLALYNAIANGGRFVRPRLVQRIFGDGIDSVMDVTYIRKQVCSEANAAKLREMLRRVVWGEHGTAKLLRSDDVAIAGKTGTAFVIEKGRYNTDKKRLAFCGFFPADKPQYSCIVLVSNPRLKAGASSTSGMVLKNIALKLYSRGMLNNHSDYKTGGNSKELPELYAASDPSRTRAFRQSLGMTSEHRTTDTSADDVPSGALPSVVGYGVRDAIAMLERAGYNVRIKGSGCVTAQEPVAGTKLRTGSRVLLTLSN
ncbi:MAG: transpeptidase family protein [Muribaculaceae bacterium]|nr:transpeptidase family protein [Muribaculaceae bacterium]